MQKMFDVAVSVQGKVDMKKLVPGMVAGGLHEQAL